MQLAELETVPGEDGGSEVVAVEVDNPPPPREQQLRAESPQNDAEAQEDDDDDVMVDVEATIARYFQDNSACPIEVEEYNDYQVDLGDMQNQFGSGNLPNSGVKVNSINAVKSDVTIGTKVIIKGRTTVIVNKSEKSNGALPAPSAPAEKTDVEKTDGVAEQPVDGHKLSSCSSHPFIPFSRNKAAEWFRSRLCVIGIFFAVLLMISLAAVLYVIFNPGTQKPPAPISPNDTSINNDPTISGVRIVPRIEWGAQPPENPANKLSIIPAPLVIISHTVTNFCFTQAQCVFIVRVTQTFHIESKGWDDIAYNFLVGGDGLVYEGRGWDVEGAHTFNYNVKSIGISFIGTFNKQEPTKAQLYAAKKLIEYGVQNGKIAKDYKLLGHRQCIKTESPGQALYDIIRTWDHWSPTP